MGLVGKVLSQLSDGRSAVRLMVAMPLRGHLIKPAKKLIVTVEPQAVHARIFVAE